MVLPGLAARNLFRNLRRTLITVCSIAVSLAALIFQQSLLKSLQGQVVRRATEYWTGHVVIHARGFQEKKSLDERMEHPGKLYALLNSAPGVAGWTERLYSSGLASVAGASQGVVIIGVDPAREGSVSTMGAEMARGTYLKPGDDRAVIIGEKLAKELGADLGDKVVLMSQAADGALAAELFRVKGVIKTGSSDFVMRGGIITLAGARRMLAAGETSSEFALRLESAGDSDKTARWFRARLNPSEYEVLTWEDLQGWVSGMMRFQDAVLLVVLAIIFLIVSFGILNTLLMSVFERIREFGIIMALGMKPRQVVGLVLWEAVWLGLAGMAAGNALGAAVVLHYGRHGLPLPLGKAFSDVMPFDPVIFLRMQPRYLLISSAAVIITCFLASIIPALRASRLKPVEAFRHV